MNPAAPVRGPSHIVKKGKTPVLDGDEARKLIESIDVSTTKSAATRRCAPCTRTARPAHNGAGFSAAGSARTALTRSTRESAHGCKTASKNHLPEIEAWRQNIGLTQRLKLNHPNTVWRGWQAAQTASNKGDGSISPPPNRKDMEIVRLQEELDAANRKLRNRDDLSEGRDWTWHDTPEQIAAAMLRLYPDKAKRLGSALQNAAKSTTRKPRTPAAKQRDDS
jgi:hypothetical protein